MSYLISVLKWIFFVLPCFMYQVSPPVNCVLRNETLSHGCRGAHGVTIVVVNKSHPRSCARLFALEGKTELEIICLIHAYTARVRVYVCFTLLLFLSVEIVP